jgi:hypothetical protein
MDKWLLKSFKAFSFLTLYNPIKIFKGAVFKPTGNTSTFVEKEDHEIGFGEHYNKYLRSHINLYEINRVVALKEARKRILISIPFMAIIFIAMLYLLISMFTTKELFLEDDISINDCPIIPKTKQVLTNLYVKKEIVGFNFLGETYVKLLNDNAAFVLGCYMRVPIQNARHTGSIYFDDLQLKWKDAAGVSWNILTDFKNNKLITNDDNPYADSVDSNFNLLFKGDITASWENSKWKVDSSLSQYSLWDDDLFHDTFKRSGKHSNFWNRDTKIKNVIIGVRNPVLKNIVSNDAKFFLMILLLSLGGGFIISAYTKPLRDYHGSIKDDIFPAILSFLDGFKYTPKVYETWYMTKFKEFDIIPSYENENNEDHIQGKYKGVNISLCESHLMNKKEETLFKGIVISLDIHKYFKGKTVVRKDFGSVGNLVGKTYRRSAEILKGSSRFSELTSVRLEDPRFEKEFEVFSTDQVEARYLLTTSFMERLLELRNKLYIQKIECSFYKNVLLMMISTKKDMFEPGSIFEPADFVDDVRSLLIEMNLIFEIIDILKLDMDIGL